MATKPMSGSAKRRIMGRAAKGKPFVVVPKDGVPSRIFDLDKYLEKREATRKAKPWSFRRRKPSSPDPLGAIEGTVISDLGRDEMYE